MPGEWPKKSEAIVSGLFKILFFNRDCQVERTDQSLLYHFTKNKMLWGDERRGCKLKGVVIPWLSMQTLTVITVSDVGFSALVVSSKFN